MAGNDTQRSGFFAVLHILPALTFLLLGMAVLAMPSAAQEERPRKPRSLLEFLFRGGEEAKKPEVRKPVAAKPKKKRAAVARTAASTEPAVVAVEKAPDAKVVLVVGDFMAGGLAEGLTTVFETNAAVRVVDRTNGSSGFARSDFYDWPEEIKTLMETEKPAAVVVMLGSNDRQQIKIGDVREQPLTEAWQKEYAARTAALGASIKARGVPFIWVGLPAFKSKKMTSDMLVLNDAYRQAAVSAGGEFIDIWDGFVDENGAYVTNGPDMNGQPVKLRGNDGINLSKPGKRKVAFYTEKPLARILGTTGVPGTGAPGIASPETGEGQRRPVDIDRTAPMSLSDPELDGGTELLGLKVDAKDKPGTASERMTIEGVAPEPTPGRADDFQPASQLAGEPAGQPGPAQPAAAAAQIETTTAIRR